MSLFTLFHAVTPSQYLHFTHKWDVHRTHCPNQAPRPLTRSMNGGTAISSAGPRGADGDSAQTKPGSSQKDTHPKRLLHFPNSHTRSRGNWGGDPCLAGAPKHNHSQNKKRANKTPGGRQCRWGQGFCLPRPAVPGAQQMTARGFRKGLFLLPPTLPPIPVRFLGLSGEDTWELHFQDTRMMKLTEVQKQKNPALVGLPSKLPTATGSRV